MSYKVDDSVFFQVSVKVPGLPGDSVLPLTPGTVIRADLIQNTHQLLPTFHLTWLDVSRLQAQTGILADGCQMSVILGADSPTTPSTPLTFRLFHIKELPPTEQGRIYQIHAELDLPEFTKKRPTRPHTGTSASLMQKIADGLGLNADIDPTDDHQVWRHGNKTIGQWAGKAASRGWASDTSAMVMCLTHSSGVQQVLGRIGNVGIGSLVGPLVTTLPTAAQLASGLTSNVSTMNAVRASAANIDSGTPGYSAFNDQLTKTHAAYLGLNTYLPGDGNRPQINRFSTSLGSTQGELNLLMNAAAALPLSVPGVARVISQLTTLARATTLLGNMVGSMLGGSASRGINSNNPFMLRYRDINSLLTGRTEAVFFNANDAPGGNKFWCDGYKVVSRAGRQNARSGYGYRVATEQLDGTTVRNESVKVLRTSGSLDINRAVSELVGIPRRVLAKLDTGNNHPKWEKARHQNDRISATYSKDLYVSTPHLTGLRLLDPVETRMYDMASGQLDPNAQGRHIVSGKTQAISGLYYREIFELNGQGPQDNPGDLT